MVEKAKKAVKPLLRSVLPSAPLLVVMTALGVGFGLRFGLWSALIAAGTIYYFDKLLDSWGK